MQKVDILFEFGIFLKYFSVFPSVNVLKLLFCYAKILEKMFRRSIMACTLLFIRHGQSLGNMVRSFLGHTDLDLSPLGYEQAQCV